VQILAAGGRERCIIHMEASQHPHWGETTGEEIRTAITATLLRMAAEARREEDRMFLALLAQLVDRQPKLDAHD